MEKAEKKPYITFLLMLSEKEGMEPNEFQIPYGSQRASLLLHWIEGNRESARVVVLNLDSKILMTEVCWDGCYKCFLINVKVLKLAPGSLGMAESWQWIT